MSLSIAKVSRPAELKINSAWDILLFFPGKPYKALRQGAGKDVRALFKAHLKVKKILGDEYVKSVRHPLYGLPLLNRHLDVNAFKQAVANGRLVVGIADPLDTFSLNCLLGAIATLCEEPVRDDEDLFTVHEKILKSLLKDNPILAPFPAAVPQKKILPACYDTSAEKKLGWTQGWYPDNRVLGKGTLRQIREHFDFFRKKRYMDLSDIDMSADPCDFSPYSSSELPKMWDSDCAKESFERTRDSLLLATCCGWPVAFAKKLGAGGLLVLPAGTDPDALAHRLSELYETTGCYGYKLVEAYAKEMLSQVSAPEKTEEAGLSVHPFMEGKLQAKNVEDAQPVAVSDQNGSAKTEHAIPKKPDGSADKKATFSITLTSIECSSEKIGQRDKVELKILSPGSEEPRTSKPTIINFLRILYLWALSVEHGDSLFFGNQSKQGIFLKEKGSCVEPKGSGLFKTVKDSDKPASFVTNIRNVRDTALKDVFATNSNGGQKVFSQIQQALFGVEEGKRKVQLSKSCKMNAGALCFYITADQVETIKSLSLEKGSYDKERNELFEMIRSALNKKQ